MTISGNWLDEMELEAIVSYPSADNLFRLDNFNNLDANFRTRLHDLVCNSRWTQNILFINKVHTLFQMGRKENKNQQWWSVVN